MNNRLSIHRQATIAHLYIDLPISDQQPLLCGGVQAGVVICGIRATVEDHLLVKPGLI